MNLYTGLWRGILVPFDWIRILWGRFLTFWFRPMDPLPLRIFEALLCISMVYYFAGYLKTPELWLTNEGFHLSEAATNTSYIPPPPLAPVAWVKTIVISFYTLCFIYIIGYGRRILNWVFFAGVVYVQAMDQPTSFTINRMFIISFLFLALQPPVVVVDGKKRISGWIIRLFQATLLIQYCTAGICKMSPGDWEDRVGDILWTHSQGHYKNYLSAWAVNHLPMFCFGIMGVMSLVFEFAAPVLFGWRKIRHYTVLFGIVFHLSIALLMKDLIYFSLQMITVYILFVDVNLIRRVLRLPEKETPSEGESTPLQLSLAKDNSADLYRNFLRPQTYGVASILDRSLSTFIKFAIPFSFAYGFIVLGAFSLLDAIDVSFYNSFTGWAALYFSSLLAFGFLYPYADAYLAKRTVSFRQALTLSLKKLPYTLECSVLITVLLIPTYWANDGLLLFLQLELLLCLLPVFALSLKEEVAGLRAFGKSFNLTKDNLIPLLQLGWICILFYAVLDWGLYFLQDQVEFSIDVLRGKLKLDLDNFMPQVFLHIKLFVFSTLLLIASIVVYRDLDNSDQNDDVIDQNAPT